jgi:hypothetical protein
MLTMPEHFPCVQIDEVLAIASRERFDGAQYIVRDSTHRMRPLASAEPRGGSSCVTSADHDAGEGEG